VIVVEISVAVDAMAVSPNRLLTDNGDFAIRNEELVLVAVVTDTVAAVGENRRHRTTER